MPVCVFKMLNSLFTVVLADFSLSVSRILITAVLLDFLDFSLQGIKSQNGEREREREMMKSECEKAPEHNTEAE